MNLGTCKRHAVAGNHDHRIGNCRARCFFWNRKNNDGTAFLSIFLKTFCRQSFAGFSPLDVFEGDALAVLPSWVKNGRLQLRAPGSVWVALGCDVESALSGTLHYGDKLWRVLESHAG